MYLVPRSQTPEGHVFSSSTERPLHFLEKVLDVTLRWTEWPEDFCRDNYLVVKENYVYSHVDNVVSARSSEMCPNVAKKMCFCAV